MKSKLFFIASAMIITGCAATGENLKGNVYQAGQVNQMQAARSVRIISILPAQVEIDNSKQKQQAQVGGAMLGALAGGLGAGLGTDTVGWGILGAAGGGAVGAAAGSLVNDRILVQGVTLGYTENGRMFSSTQVGQPCEFMLGTSMIIATMQGETRIQSNANCTVK